jgi:hypothetical protein
MPLLAGFVHLNGPFFCDTVITVIIMIMIIMMHV